MRRYAIFTAGAALVLGSLAIPGMAVANGRTTTPQESTEVSAQSAQLDNEITALGKGRGKGHGKGKSAYRKGYRRGYRLGYGYGGYGYGSWPGGYGYGGHWPGGYGYGGFWRGGFGCNFDYPCGPPFDEQCRSFRGAPAADPRCQAQQTQPAPGQSAQPAPDASTQPAPAPGQTAQPAPDASTQPAPAPDAGMQPAPAPAPGQSNTQPRPY